MTGYDTDDIGDVLQGRHVIDMLTLANEYCLFIENCQGYEIREITDYLRRVLPMLYIKGSMLPPVEADEDYITEKFVSEEHWENIYKTLLERFSEIPEDAWADNQSHAALLADTLADIYQDLKDFVVLFQKPLTIEKQNAVADCQQAFQPFWGHKASMALPVLHSVAGAGPEGSHNPNPFDALWDE